MTGLRRLEVFAGLANNLRDECLDDSPLALHVKIGMEDPARPRFEIWIEGEPRKFELRTPWPPEEPEESYDGSCAPSEEEASYPSSESP